MALREIVSGGQTGVDRGALDAALRNGFPCGGWCPAGRRAEDGTIPESYPLREMPSRGYLARTIQNVIDSDGTVLICFGALSGGTRQTLLQCIRRQRPYRLIDASEMPPDRAAMLVADFVKSESIAKLNIAGPRSSEEPAAYSYAREVIDHLLAS